MNLTVKLSALVILVNFFPKLLNAQFLIAPPDGNNQRSSVSQNVGIAEVTIEYSSPDVDGRRGKIWGELVPFDKVWRAGANKNTTLTISHDATIQGEKVTAGTYGLFMIPSQQEFTLILSNNSSSWGTFVYNEKEDELRVKINPLKSEYNEWLTYSPVERHTDRTTIALKWEERSLPFEIVFDIHQITIESFKNQLRSAIGLFVYEGTYEAASYCLNNNVYLDQGLIWARESVDVNSNFKNNLLRSQLLNRLDRSNEAKAAYDQALALGTPHEIYYHGRSLINQGQFDMALEVFKHNYKKYGGEVWPTHLGLGRGYQAVGNKKKAIEHYQKALKTASLDRQVRSIKNFIKDLNE